MSALQSPGLDPEARLKSLKNAKRRVMPGEEEIQNLDQFNPDIAGTANPMPSPSPQQNMPQPAVSSQVSAQSYDTRANRVMTAPPVPVEPPQPVMANPNPTKDPSLMNRLGENLKSEWKQRPGAFSYMPESIAHPATEEIKPEEMYGQQQPEAKDIYGTAEQQPSLISRLGSSLKQTFTPDFSISPETRKKVEELDKTQLNVQPLKAKAKEYFKPSDEIANNPKLQEEFKNQTGDEFTPEIKQRAEIGQAAKDYIDNGGDKTVLDDQSQRLVDRIESNKATDADMYTIGLALVTSLIVGKMFGKEAGFGALAGGMKGMGDIYESREKDTQEAEKLLAEIDKTKATQQAAAAKGDLASAFPDVEWEDENGQKHQNKEISPGISIEGKYLNSKEQIHSVMERHKEIIKYAKNASDLIEPLKRYKSIIEQLKEQDNDGFFNQYKQWALHNYDPQLSAKFAPNVIIDGKEVNAATALRKAMADANGPYALTYHAGQPDAAQQALQAKLLGDPTSGFISTDQAEYMVNSFLEQVLSSVDREVKFNGMRFDPERFLFEKESKGIKDKKHIESESRESESLRSGSVERGE